MEFSVQLYFHSKNELTEDKVRAFGRLIREALNQTRPVGYSVTSVATTVRGVTEYDRKH